MQARRTTRASAVVLMLVLGTPGGARTAGAEDPAGPLTVDDPVVDLASGQSTLTLRNATSVPLEVDLSAEVPADEAVTIAFDGAPRVHLTVPPTGVQAVEVTSDPGLGPRGHTGAAVISVGPSPARPEGWVLRVPLTGARRPAYPAIARIESSQTSLWPRSATIDIPLTDTGSCEDVEPPASPVGWLTAGDRSIRVEATCEDVGAPVIRAVVPALGYEGTTASGVIDLQPGSPEGAVELKVTRKPPPWIAIALLAASWLLGMLVTRRVQVHRPALVQRRRIARLRERLPGLDETWQQRTAAAALGYRHWTTQSLAVDLDRAEAAVEGRRQSRVIGLAQDSAFIDATTLIDQVTTACDGWEELRDTLRGLDAMSDNLRVPPYHGLSRVDAISFTAFATTVENMLDSESPTAPEFETRLADLKEAAGALALWAAHRPMVDAACSSLASLVVQAPGDPTVQEAQRSWEKARVHAEKATTSSEVVPVVHDHVRSAVAAVRFADAAAASTTAVHQPGVGGAGGPSELPWELAVGLLWRRPPRPPAERLRLHQRAGDLAVFLVVGAAALWVGFEVAYEGTAFTYWDHGSAVAWGLTAGVVLTTVYEAADRLLDSFRTEG